MLPVQAVARVPVSRATSSKKITSAMGVPEHFSQMNGSIKYESVSITTVLAVVRARKIYVSPSH